MAYFPFFVDLTGKKGVIVGGGTVALRKIEKLLPFSADLYVIAPEICAEVRAIQGIHLIERRYVPGDEAEAYFVIAATGDAECNHQISARCKEQNILVNVVDDAAYCGFLFPSLVQQGDLTIGISTGGSSPTAAICLKKQIAALIPDQFDEILDFLHRQRDEIKALVPNEKERHVLLRQLFFACVQVQRPLGQEEVRSMLPKEIHI